MTRDKDRKRIIRSRMKKTGESYTAARSQIVSKARPTRPAPATPARTAAPDYAALAGMTDATISTKTGRSWGEWVRVLDADDAASLPHGDIARLVHGKHKVGDWWAQTVTVGYERIKGLRDLGQRRGGSYEANKSKTFHVPVAALFDAWADDRLRRRWLDAEPTVRSATRSKYMRLNWPDRTIVIVGFLPKGESKSAVAVTHTKLGDKAAIAKAKKYWTEKLDALGSMFAAKA